MDSAADTFESSDDNGNHKPVTPTSAYGASPTSLTELEHTKLSLMIEQASHEATRRRLHKYLESEDERHEKAAELYRLAYYLCGKIVRLETMVEQLCGSDNFKKNYLGLDENMEALQRKYFGSIVERNQNEAPVTPLSMTGEMNNHGSYENVDSNSTCYSNGDDLVSDSPDAFLTRAGSGKPIEIRFLLCVDYHRDVFATAAEIPKRVAQAVQHLLQHGSCSGSEIQLHRTIGWVHSREDKVACITCTKRRRVCVHALKNSGIYTVLPLPKGLRQDVHPGQDEYWKAKKSLTNKQLKEMWRAGLTKKSARAWA